MGQRKSTHPRSRGRSAPASSDASEPARSAGGGASDRDVPTPDEGADDPRRVEDGEGSVSPSRPAPPDAADDIPTWDLEDVEDEPAAPETVAFVEAAEAPSEEDAVDLAVDPGISDDAERAALLAAILRDHERRSRVWEPPPPRRSSRPTRIAAAVLGLVAVWLWLLPPGWLQPDLPPPVPVELQEAGLRLGMYLQAQQIESFRRSRGRLPDVLEETGEPIPGMHYRRLDARVYRLHGIAASVALTYTSTDTLSVFLSNAQHVVGFSPSR